MKTEIINMQSVVDITDELKDIIQRCVNETMVIEKIKFKCECNIILTDNNTIREYNMDFRGLDSATDVLSFPILDFIGDIKDLNTDDIKYDINPETGHVMLGDIIISMDKVIQQSKEYGHSIKRELGFLIVHGMLHLLGYDHEEIKDREKMRKKEEYILNKIGLKR